MRAYGLDPEVKLPLRALTELRKGRERIAELEEALEDTQSKLGTLKRLTDRIHDVGARAQVEEIIDEEALAA